MTEVANNARIYKQGWNAQRRSGFLGKIHSEESLRKMSLAHIGNTNWLGKKFSNEHKQKISKSLKCKMPENIYSIIGCNKGKKMSEEARQRMSVARMGKKLSDETKRRMSEAQKRIGNHPPIKKGENNEDEILF